MLHVLTLIVIPWLCKKILLVMGSISIWTQSAEVSLLVDGARRKDVRTVNPELVVSSSWPFPELPGLGHTSFVP